MADQKPVKISDDGMSTDEFTASDSIGIVDGGTGAVTQNAALNNLLPSQTGNADKILQTDGNDASWVEAAEGSATCESFTQTAHGLAVGDVVRYASGAWAKAQANTGVNSEATAVVSEVADANNLTVCYSGRLNGLSGLTPDCVYFLDDTTPGLLTLTEPTISKPILFATSATSAVILIMRALDSVAGGGGSAIEVEDEGISLTTDVTKFNFVGDGVTVSEPLADEVTVTIPGTVVGGGGNGAGADYYSTVQTTFGTSPTTLTLNTIRESDTAFSLSGNEVTINEAGKYIFVANANLDNDGTSHDAEFWLEKNGTEIAGTKAALAAFNDDGGSASGSSIIAYLDLSASDVVRIRAQSSNAGADTLANGVRLVAFVTGSEMPVFGSEYQYSEVEADSTTTSTTFQTKVTLVTGSLPLGNYQIGYAYEPGCDTNGVIAEYRVQRNGIDIAIGSFEADSDRHQWSGFKQDMVSGVQTYTIQYRSTDGVAGAQIRHARLQIWRIS